MRFSNVQSLLLAVCLLLCPLGASAQTPDHEKFWTTVGSAGTLDEKSEGKVIFDHAVVQMGQISVISSSGRQLRAEGGVEETDSAVIRYNVTAVDGMFGGKAPAMAVRFRAEGASARVVAQLIEVDIVTGAEVTLLTFDSDANGVPAQSGYHVFDVFNCRGGAFDFTRKAYYIEATLTTSVFSENSAAGIQMIQLLATSC
jgi:acyl-CoA hydrolase